MNLFDFAEMQELAKTQQHIPTPREYGLPVHHTAWREHQYESVVWGLGVKGVGILSAPVGSGKTGVAKAVASQKREIALAQTKLLQSTVYKEHGFDVLMGKGNYKCVNGTTDNADTCPWANMSECEDSWRCAYVQARQKAKESDAASLNYAYFLVSPMVKIRPPDVLVLDECHLLSEIVLGHIGMGLKRSDMDAWGLHSPPEMLVDLQINLLARRPPALEGMDYLRSIIPVLEPKVKRLIKKADPADMKRLNWGKRLLSNAYRTAELIEQDPTLWFVEGTPEMFRAKPLTARYHYDKLFKVSPTTIMMSATVGDFSSLADELGQPEYATRAVQSRYAPERRPIIVLDGPKLSYHSTPEDYDYQADAIANAIQAFDPMWSGLIHVNKKAAAPELAERLARRGLQDRVWVTPTTNWKGKRAGTDEQMKAWVAHKRKSKGNGKQGQLAIAWSWHEGVDLGDEKICICAKVPFCSLADPYERARFAFSRGFYAQRAAWQLQQQLGRTRRGNEEDYDTDDDVRGLVAIADGNWTRVKGYLSEDFTESILEVI